MINSVRAITGFLSVDGADVLKGNGIRSIQFGIDQVGNLMTRNTVLIREVNLKAIVTNENNNVLGVLEMTDGVLSIKRGDISEPVYINASRFINLPLNVNELTVFFATPTVNYASTNNGVQRFFSYQQNIPDLPFTVNYYCTVILEYT